MGRRIGLCLGPCGRDAVEIVGNDMCRRCFQKYWRFQEKQRMEDGEEFARPDRTQRRHHKELADALGFFVRMKTGLEKLASLPPAILPDEKKQEILEAVNRAIVRITRPELSEIPDVVFTQENSDELTVNSENFELTPEVNVNSELE